MGDLTLPPDVTAITDAGELLVLIEAVYMEPSDAEDEAAADEAGAAGESEADAAEPAEDAGSEP